MESLPEKMIVRVPASTANLGSGFDSIGMAFQLYITIEVELSHETSFIWSGKELKNIQIRDEDNLILKGMNQVFQLLKEERPAFKVKVISDIPLTRGLGSSASAYVAGIVAANEWLGKPLSDDQLLWLGTEEEGHPDNIGASIFGGVFMAAVDWKKKCVQYYRQNFPNQWSWIAAIPSYPLSTSKARQLLPSSYEKKEAIFNLSRYGILVASLMTANKEGVALGLEDCWHQPYRQQLIPGFEELLKTREELGAIGFVISGAGPTVLGLVENNRNHQLVEDAMRTLMNVENETIDILPLAVDQEGYIVHKQSLNIAK